MGPCGDSALGCPASVSEPQELKPDLVHSPYRGPQGPLFHVSASVSGVSDSPRVNALYHPRLVLMKAVLY